jgi:hypothetical protein
MCHPVERLGLGKSIRLWYLRLKRGKPHCLQPPATKRMLARLPQLLLLVRRRQDTGNPHAHPPPLPALLFRAALLASPAALPLQRICAASPCVAARLTSARAAPLRPSTRQRGSALCRAPPHHRLAFLRCSALLCARQEALLSWSPRQAPRRPSAPEATCLAGAP